MTHNPASFYPRTNDKRLPATTHMKMCLTLGQLLSLSTCTRVVDLQTPKPHKMLSHLAPASHAPGNSPGPSSVLGRGSLHGHPGDNCSTTSQPSPPHTPTCAPTVTHSPGSACDCWPQPLEVPSATTRHCPESGGPWSRTRLPRPCRRAAAPVTLSISGFCPTRTPRCLPETSRMPTGFKQCASQKGLLWRITRFLQVIRRTFSFLRNCRANCCLCRPEELLEHHEVASAFDSPWSSVVLVIVRQLSAFYDLGPDSGHPYCWERCAKWWLCCPVPTILHDVDLAQSTLSKQHKLHLNQRLMSISTTFASKTCSNFCSVFVGWTQVSAPADEFSLKCAMQT